MERTAGLPSVKSDPVAFENLARGPDSFENALLVPPPAHVRPSVDPSRAAIKASREIRIFLPMRQAGI